MSLLEKLKSVFELDDDFGTPASSPFARELEPDALIQYAINAVTSNAKRWPDGLDLPDTIVLKISPQDYEYFGPRKTACEARIASAIREYAASSNVISECEPLVTLLFDSSLDRGQMSAATSFSTPEERTERSRRQREHVARQAEAPAKAESHVGNPRDAARNATQGRAASKLDVMKTPAFTHTPPANAAVTTPDADDDPAADADRSFDSAERMPGSAAFRNDGSRIGGDAARESAASCTSDNGYGKTIAFDAFSFANDEEAGKDAALDPDAVADTDSVANPAGMSLTNEAANAAGTDNTADAPATADENDTTESADTADTHDAADAAPAATPAFSFAGGSSSGTLDAHVFTPQLKSDWAPLPQAAKLVGQDRQINVIDGDVVGCLRKSTEPAPSIALDEDDYPYLSQKHATFAFRDGVWSITSFGRNGTSVQRDGVWASLEEGAPYELRDGDRISFARATPLVFSLA